ncbi:Uu.00g039540.m01.CDS01 [Anthostomella pinea]|uniref:Uu.00g039540.m01.CDS01 n=1 Tax=Anthostomella pinea TaxID=933095 RepID=A0AAI8VB22_9PEZI|nr:Uu.00g039540.m01.CDS01 [Anthostomella pinea]
MQINRSLLAALSVSSAPMLAAAAPSQHVHARDASTYQANAETALDRLQTWYSEDSGLWTSYSNGWWQSANQLTTVIDMAQLGSSKAQQLAEHVVPNTFRQAAINNENREHTGRNPYINDYYDDMGWWAMAWIRAYDLTQNTTYLTTAEDLFNDMRYGWTTKCTPDGGLWWDKENTFIAPISNTLFIEVAGSLANRVAWRKDYYTMWARNAWNWLSTSVLYAADQHLLMGSIKASTCVQNERPDSFTYSHGALVGGLIELSSATGETKYTDEAHLVAGAVLDSMTKDGVLYEQNIDNEHPGESAPQFKGVFMRALSSLNAQSPKTEYKTLAQKSADSIWENDRDSEGNLGPDWNGPFFGSGNASPHSSAMDAIVFAWKASQ